MGEKTSTDTVQSGAQLKLFFFKLVLSLHYTLYIPDKPPAPCALKCNKAPAPCYTRCYKAPYTNINSDRMAEYLVQKNIHYMILN